MRYSLLFAAVLLAAAPCLSQEPASPPVLTERQLVEEALRSHPTLQAAEARVRAAEARLRGARAGLNPEATLQHGFGKDTGGLDEDVSISQLFELGGKRHFRAGEAAHERSRAAVELEAARLEVAYQARLAYLAVQEAAALRDQAREGLRLAERFRGAAQTQFDLGEVPRTQVIRSEVEEAARRQTLDEAQTELEARTASLNSLAGRPLAAGGAPAAPLAAAAVEGALEQWRAAAAARPEVTAARAQLAARQAGLGAARAASVPDLFVTGVHADLRELPGNSIRVGVTVPLLDRGSLRARRDEARAGVAEQEANVKEALRQAEVDVTVAYTQATRAAARLERYRTGQLEQARKLAELAEVGYRAGHNSFLEVLDAQRAYLEAQAGYLRALADAARFRLALQRAAGSPALLGP